MNPWVSASGCKSILACAAWCLLVAGQGCASGSPDLTAEGFKQSGPLAAGEWSLFVGFKGGAFSAASRWNLRVDSNGNLLAQIRSWDPDHSKWRVEEKQATLASSELGSLADVVAVFAEANLPALVSKPHVNDVSGYRIACWRGREYHEVFAYGLETLVEPIDASSRDRSPPDPEMVRAAGCVLLLLSHVMQFWPSPNAWQTTDYFVDLGERAVALMSEQR